MRVTGANAYVLHSREYGETSLIVELFSREYGRVSVVAKGARKNRSKYGSPLSPFQLLTTSWSGKTDLHVLTGIEAQTDPRLLSGDALFSAFYVNELLLRLLHKHDPHEELFDAYQLTLEGLELGDPEKYLRRFERKLLLESGYALVLDETADTKKQIELHEKYFYIPDLGPVAAGSDGIPVSGSVLVALATDDFDDAVVKSETKHFMRCLLDYYLDGRTLHTRNVLKRTRRNKVSAQESLDS